MSQAPSYKKNKKPYGYVLISQFIRFAAYDLGVQGRDKTFLVLAIIASHANSEGVCFPSLSKVGEKLEISRQAISQHVRILKEQKYLFVEHPWADQTRKRTNIYRLNFKKLDEEPASSLDCRQQQDSEIAAPERSLPCAKKTMNKPNIRNSFLHWFKRKKQEQGNYFQIKEREEATGISQQDHEELARLRDIAYQGMTSGQRVEKDLEIQKAAKEYSDNTQQRMHYMLQAYINMIG